MRGVPSYPHCEVPSSNSTGQAVWYFIHEPLPPWRNEGDSRLEGNESLGIQGIVPGSSAMRFLTSPTRTGIVEVQCAALD